MKLIHTMEWTWKWQVVYSCNNDVCVNDEILFNTSHRGEIFWKFIMLLLCRRMFSKCCLLKRSRFWDVPLSIHYFSLPTFLWLMGNIMRIHIHTKIEGRCVTFVRYKWYNYYSNNFWCKVENIPTGKENLKSKDI